LSSRRHKHWLVMSSRNGENSWFVVRELVRSGTERQEPTFCPVARSPQS
jgi:hypothetical protein